MNTVIGTASRIAAEQPAGAYPARMKLDQVRGILGIVAPLRLAEDWDQVGLHLSHPDRTIKRGLLCIDLTPAVLTEAVQQKCQLIVAYHPPIFHPLQRLADMDWKQQMLAEAIRKGIAVYSPHTALDAVRGGVNDWICDGLGKQSSRFPIGYEKTRRTEQYKVVVFVPRADADRLRKAMSQANAGNIGRYSECSFNVDGLGTFRGEEGTSPTIGKPGRLETVEETRVEMICWQSQLAEVMQAIRDSHPYEEPAIDVLELAAVPPRLEDEQAAGRIHNLARAVTPQTLVARVKKQLGVKHVKAAIPADLHTNPRFMQFKERGRRNRHKQIAGAGKITSIAVCAGAGGSLFESLGKRLGANLIDAYITGEMQHHQVLDLYLKGKVVILAGHTNTERPFLKNYRERIIEQGGGKVEWLISEADQAPMQIV